MRIVCPSCEAEYDVPDTLLANGPRKVRCARCAREWEPFAPPPPLPPPPPINPLASLDDGFNPPPLPGAPPPRDPRPQDPMLDDLPAAPPPRGGPKLADAAPPLKAPRERPVMRVPGGPPSVGLVIGWLLSAAVVVALIGAAWLKRPEIVAAWPPAKRLYTLFGLD